MYLASFITIAVVHLLAVVSPGPGFLMVTRHSLMHSRKAGISVAIGIGLGSMVHITYSLIGIGLLISRSLLLFNVVKYAGAGYLFFIGVKSLRAKKSADGEESKTPPERTLTPFIAVRTGILTEILNPKATLFFLALFTQFIDPLTPKYVEVLYGAEMVFVGMLWFTLVALLFSNSKVRARLEKVQHHIERVTGLVLVSLGVKLALASRE